MQELALFTALAIQMIALAVIALKSKPDSRAMLEWFKGI